mmetsp:Transcript_17676/g.21304  ORF Transcript_17676/g.21304 Transcript_17676/m.21304 type:complete len:271 (+) Transcript_17676:576-1388(+)
MKIELVRASMPELYAGLSIEENLQKIFSIAEAKAPCVLLIDEMYSDTPCGRTNLQHHHKGGGVVVDYYLEFLRKIENEKLPIIVVASSNMPASCPARFVQAHNERLFFPFPDLDRRRQYFESKFFMLNDNDSKYVVSRGERDQAISKVLDKLLSVSEMFDFARIGNMDHYARVRFIKNYIIAAEESTLSSQQERVQAMEKSILESIEEHLTVHGEKRRLRFHVIETCCLAEFFYGATSFLSADFQLNAISNVLRKAFNDYKMSVVQNNKN